MLKTRAQQWKRTHPQGVSSQEVSRFGRCRNPNLIGWKEDHNNCHLVRVWNFEKSMHKQANEKSCNFAENAVKSHEYSSC